MVTKTGCNGLSKVSTNYDTFYGKRNIKNMKTLVMSEAQIKLQNQNDEIKKQLVLIKKTITLLNDIKEMTPIVRVECKENINKLMNWIYE